MVGAQLEEAAERFFDGFERVGPLYMSPDRTVAGVVADDGLGWFSVARRREGFRPSYEGFGYHFTPDRLEDAVLRGSHRYHIPLSPVGEVDEVVPTFGRIYEATVERDIRDGLLSRFLTETNQALLDFVPFPIVRPFVRSVSRGKIDLPDGYAVDFQVWAHTTSFIAYENPVQHGGKGTGIMWSMETTKNIVRRGKRSGYSLSYFPYTYED